MSNYYEFDDNGVLKRVSRGQSQTVGLKYVSDKKAEILSHGKHKEHGWILSDDISPPAHYLPNDSLGVSGVLNHADGKMYDSRSEYYRAVKEKGLVIVGDDAPREISTPKSKDIDWRKAVAETVKTKTPKGKRK